MVSDATSSFPAPQSIKERGGRFQLKIGPGWLGISIEVLDDPEYETGRDHADYWIILVDQHGNWLDKVSVAFMRDCFVPSMPKLQFALNACGNNEKEMRKLIRRRWGLRKWSKSIPNYYMATEQRFKELFGSYKDDGTNLEGYKDLCDVEYAHDDQSSDAGGTSDE